MPNEISKDELSYNEKVELFKELIFGKAANDDFEPKKRVSHKEKSIFPKEKLVVSTSKVEQSSSDFAVGDKGNACSTAQLILKAAEEVFLRDGFAAATTSAIAKSAGVTHAMLHYYFKTKENLFKHIFQQKVAELIASLQNAFGNSNLPFVERIVSGAQRHFDFLKENPRLPAFVMRDILGHPLRSAMIGFYFKQFYSSTVSDLQQQADELSERGEIASVKITDLLLDIASLNVFAFLIKPSAETLKELYATTPEGFLERRKQEIAETLRRRLKP